VRQCVSECEHQHQWKHHRQINEPKPGHIYLSPHEQSREKNPSKNGGKGCGLICEGYPTRFFTTKHARHALRRSTAAESGGRALPHLLARAQRGAAEAALFPDVLDLIEAAAFDEMPEGGTLGQSRGFVCLDGVPSPVGSLSLCAHLYLPCAYLAGLFLFGRPMLNESGGSEGPGGFGRPFCCNKRAVH
jgi:hypothetical protein